MFPCEKLAGVTLQCGDKSHVASYSGRRTRIEREGVTKLTTTTRLALIVLLLLAAIYGVIGCKLDRSLAGSDAALSPVSLSETQKG